MALDFVIRVGEHNKSFRFLRLAIALTGAGRSRGSAIETRGDTDPMGSGGT